MEEYMLARQFRLASAPKGRLQIRVRERTLGLLCIGVSIAGTALALGAAFISHRPHVAPVSASPLLSSARSGNADRPGTTGSTSGSRATDLPARPTNDNTPESTASSAGQAFAASARVSIPPRALNVRSFGAVGNGAANDQPAIQR